MSIAYMTLEEFKSAYRMDRSNDDDQIILDVLEAASEQLDDLVGGRHFYPVIETRYFSGNGGKVLELPDGWDLIAITTLKEDSNGDGTYDVTWAATDYELAPYNANPTNKRHPNPYYILEVNRRDTGNQDYFVVRQKAYELVGEWGVCKLTEDTGTTVSAEQNSTSTSLVVPDGSKIERGQLLLIDSEYEYVTAEPVPEGGTVTVERGVNGSTAATHLAAAAISKVVFPRTVKMATFMQAARLWTRRSSGFSSQIGFNDLGGTTIPQIGLDQDYWQMVEKSWRLKTGIA